MGQYLEKYVKTYGGYELKLNTKVVRTVLDGAKWRVCVRDLGEQEQQEVSLRNGSMTSSDGLRRKAINLTV